MTHSGNLAQICGDASAMDGCVHSLAFSAAGVSDRYADGFPIGAYPAWPQIVAGFRKPMVARLAGYRQEVQGLS